VRPAAPWRVAAVEALSGTRLRVSFVDGTAGDVEMQAFLDSVEVEGTVFEPLRDPERFKQVRVVLGAVAWPNGADLAPDAMYDAIRARGVWTLE
jgi:hypothetical protein